MSMTKGVLRWTMSALVCASVLGSAQARASTTFHVVYTGLATDIQDPTGLLGVAARGFSASYEDEYVFQIPNGTRVTNANYDQVFGGSAFGASTPLVDSKLTIKGVTFDFPGGYGDQQFTQHGVFMESYSNSYNPAGAWLFNYQNIHLNAPDLITDAFAGSGSGSGSFFICAHTATCSSVTETLGGTFSPASVRVFSATPEPSTWAVVLVGVFGAGTALRRRRLGGVAA